MSRERLQRLLTRPLFVLTQFLRLSPRRLVHGRSQPRQRVSINIFCFTIFLPIFSSETAVLLARRLTKKSVNRPTDQPTDRLTDQPNNRPTEQPTDSRIVRLTNQHDVRSTGCRVDRPSEFQTITEVIAAQFSTIAAYYSFRRSHVSRK